MKPISYIVHKPIERPLTKEAYIQYKHSQVYKPSIESNYASVPIQHRYHPQVKKPFGQTQFASNLPKPAESLLINQVVKPPIFVEPVPVQYVQHVEHHQPYDQHVGYYSNPSYVTLSPVFFTTPALPPLKGSEESSHTHYYLGNKLWYIPLYCGFAFVAYFGYIIIRNVVLRKINFPFGRDINANDVLDLTVRILSSVQKAAEMYDFRYQT